MGPLKPCAEGLTDWGETPSWRVLRVLRMLRVRLGAEDPPGVSWTRTQAPSPGLGSSAGVHRMMSSLSAVGVDPPPQLTLRFCVGLMTSMLLSLLSLRVTKPGGGGLKTPGCSPAPPPGSSPAWSAEASKENWPTDLGSRRGRAGCSEGTRPQSRCRRRNPRLSPQPPPPKPRARAHREGRAPSSGPRTPAAAAPEALRQSQPPAGSVSAR